MKRVAVIFFILTFVLSSLCVYADDKTPHLYGTDIEAVKGETISYPIMIENNSGIAAIKLSIGCENADIKPVAGSDGKSLEFKTGEAFAAGNAFGAVTETGGQIVWFNIKNIKKDGELFVVLFKIAETVANGKYTVNLSYSQIDTIDQKESPVKFNVTAGSITVKDKKQAGDGNTAIVPPENTDPAVKDPETTDDGDKEDIALITKEVKAVKIKLKSKFVKVKGKRTVKLTWTSTGNMKLDGYEIRRSLKKTGGKTVKFSVKATNKKYSDSKSLKKGKKYYYKIRGYKVVEGKKIYTAWSNRASRTVK